MDRPGEVPLPRFQPAGDSAVLVTFADTIDPGANRRVHSLARRLADIGLVGLGEAVPGYASLLVHYDSLQYAYQAVVAIVQQNLADSDEPAAASRRMEIPVLYGGEDGPDLEYVAAANRLSIEDVIAIHSGRDYPVYMMGFMPGFPYLGGMDPAIATPRLATPRSRIPAGSVGIAGSQTGIYPLDSPGGWRIIGRTPLRLFDLERDPPFWLAPGDLVHFIPVRAGEEA